jgi:hypothetical protein
LAGDRVDEQWAPRGQVQQSPHDLFWVQLARGTMDERIQLAGMDLGPMEAAIKVAWRGTPHRLLPSG